MKIGVVQIKPHKGDIEKNIEIHKIWIDLAISEKIDIITFPELSLTGYEPELSKKLAITEDDSRLDVFQNISDLNSITICVGAPTKSETGILISMVVFQPNKPRKVYSKQILHSDELPYFVCGFKDLILNVKNKKIALGICYETLQKEHSENAKKLGTEIYLACVAKPQKGIDKAYEVYSKIAKKYSMAVLVSNAIGYCDNFLSVGQSAVWNQNGKLLYNFGNNKEGLLIFNTENEKTFKVEKRF